METAGGNAPGYMETTTAGTSQGGPLGASEDAPRRGQKGQCPISADQIRDRWIKGARAVRPQARQYWINRAFLEGQQWIWWDRIRDRVNELPSEDRVRAVINQLWGISRRVISKLTQRELIFEVPPLAPDDAAICGAMVGEAVLRHTWKEHNWENLRTDIEWTRWLGGTAVLGLEWDPTAGVPLGYDPNSGTDFGTGDITAQVYSIGEVCTEPGSRDIEKGRWWVRALALPPDEVKDRYNLPEMPAADAAANLQPWQARVTQTERGEMPVPLTLVITYYERPNPARKQGVVATVVNGSVVEWDYWPFPFKDRLNCVCFRETVIADRWFGATVFSAGVPIQMAINASWSSIIEHMKQAGNARLMVPEGSVDDEEDWNDDPGSIVTYNGAAGEPKYLSPPQMPAWWVQQPETLKAELDDIFAMQDVSKGQAPANIESGVGLSILQDADETPVAMMVKDSAGGWSRYAQMVLQVYSVKVTESRTARVPVDGQRAPMVIRWTGKAFASQTEVEVPLEAIVPRSKAARQAWATALWDRGMLQQNPKLFARIAELPSRDNFTDALDPDLAKAQRENQAMTLGSVCIPEKFDNHATHIAAHNEFRKSERYDSLPEKLRTILDNHVETHANFAAEAMAEMAARQQVSPALEAAPNANESPAAPALHAPGAPPAAPPAGQSQAQLVEQMENSTVAPGDPDVAPGNGDQQPPEVFTPPQGPDFPLPGLRAPSRLGPSL